MKLSKKDIEYQLSHINCVYGARLVGKKFFGLMCKELLEYKDIEEELGIDLITLFKALNYGVYYVTKTQGLRNEYVALTQEYMGSKKLCLRLRIKGNPQLYIKDYGKTWALTMKELEK